MFEELAKPTANESFLNDSGSFRRVCEDFGRPALIIRITVAQQGCNQLAEEVGLSVGREADASKMTWFQTPAEQSVRRTSDLEVTVRVHGCAVGQLRWIEDPFTLKCHELVVAEA